MALNSFHIKCDFVFELDLENILIEQERDGLIDDLRENLDDKIPIHYEWIKNSFFLQFKAFSK